MTFTRYPRKCKRCHKDLTPDEKLLAAIFMETHALCFLCTDYFAKEPVD